ncbi:MAG: shikimate kinase, partial [Firmicutes bacterium]|nr:shikimate kinase [Bacillota bacterium]
AEDLGIPHWGGLTMLVSQAAAASERFTGRVVPQSREDEIERTLRREMENICLIGMPGSGKSTVGALLAQQTGRIFVDADAAVEVHAGMPVSEIFRLEGEAGFRRRESEVLGELGKRSSLVIATGGGCVKPSSKWAYCFYGKSARLFGYGRPTALPGCRSDGHVSGSVALIPAFCGFDHSK